MRVPERCVAVVLHDVAPATWPAYAPLLAVLDARAVPLTLLVVPWWHGGERVATCAWFRAVLDARLARGDEVALHGWRHLDEGPPPRAPGDWVRRRVLTAGEGEFAALAPAIAARRIAAGQAALHACGWRAEGFVAPAWLLSAPAFGAVRAAGFAYTSDRDAIYLLPSARRIAAPSLVASARSAWRRGLSGPWNRTRLRAGAGAALLRLGIHPQDCAHPRLLSWWLAIIEAACAQRVAVTKAAWCRAQAAGA